MKYWLGALWLGLLGVSLGGCHSPDSGLWQGYVEGDSLLIAAPVSGTLDKVSVSEGDQVRAGAPLFDLSPEPQQAALAQSQAQVSQARAQLQNLLSGKRPQELDVIRAQYDQAGAAAAFSARQLQRTRHLYQKGLSSREALDSISTQHSRDEHQVREMAAQLAAARLAARPEEIKAARDAVKAAQANVRQGQWQLSQKQQAAPAAALVEQVMYHAGEFVPAGQPVIELLPPERVKVRFFVPETALAQLHAGNPVEVSCDGCGRPFNATIRYISPQAEYTPPFIYSRENREKFVYLVEAWPTKARAAELHPGQPVDVRSP